ncbi:hypothetical protein F503_06958 [Ophiostoma piceae UAMH 11346]|uniref:Mmc1 C-terminal domain-containing protein n=1 Tax=Ophiostoma piceae (strain UAMH 11346) TaxID=1262450 RepID=S3C8L6_OPHP1|nr:hypothetical protein F503_06958 [Ophiostoma piceae UAMH 11346]
MPPRLRLRPSPLGTSQALLSSRTRIQSRPPACLFCSLRPTSSERPPRSFQRRASTVATTTQPTLNRTSHSPPPRPDAQTPVFSSRQLSSSPSCTELASTLRALQQHAGIVDPRFQLAVQSLQQLEGQGPVRVAVWGLGNGAGRSAKELLRLVLADPLQDEQPWEQQLVNHDPKTPLIVRVVDGKPGNSYQPAPTIHTPQVQFSAPANAKSNGGQELAEIEVSSPVLKGSQLEFLVLEKAVDTGHEDLLVPALEGESPTPVHQALVVADGIMGAATIGNAVRSDAVKGAINISLPESETPATKSGLPFFTFDPPTSNKAIALFRTSVANAKAYETLWLRGGVSDVTHWLRDSAVSQDGVKPAVRALVKSVLEAARRDIAGQAVQTVATVTAGKAEFNTLENGLASWSENAHAELQSQLDVAFSGRRWRKLGWWKLFWRADDVSMLSSGLVTQQFLPQAEQDVVYLAGRIAEAGQRTVGKTVTYSAPVIADDAKKAAALSSPLPPTAWPTHISFTRRYLIDETVPALQALADRLVVQTVGSSGMTAAVAALTFLSGGGAGVLAGEGLWVGTGVFGAGSLYEAGAVLGLGLVWSLRRLQMRWETAREFWEGEVREEGRKVVRAVEASVATALDGARTAQQALSPDEAVRRRLNEARALVDQAEEQLSRLK